MMVKELYFYTQFKILYLYEDDHLYFYGFSEKDFIPSIYVSKDQLMGNRGELVLLISFEP
jgi:hypothetical protein